MEKSEEKQDNLDTQIFKRFFANADIELQIIESILTCKSRKDYEDLVAKHGIVKMRQVLRLEPGSRIDSVELYERLKSVPYGINFI